MGLAAYEIFRTLTCSVYSELLIRRSPPRLFTAAARIGLRPAPARAEWRTDSEAKL
jgi:hypothetical protein